MNAVHHLTYARVGRELLDDLQAICTGCHEFTHAKSNVDPRSSGVAVYLAGPFVDDWRRSLYLNSSFPTMSASNTRYPEEDFPLSNGNFARIPRAIVGGFDATGPWRLEDKDEFHGLTWGHPSTLSTWESIIPDICGRSIGHSDLVFAWLPPTETPPFGTIWEMGYARALDIPVISMSPNWRPDDDNRSDMWLALAAARTPFLGQNSRTLAPLDAWKHVVEYVWPSICKYRR